MLIFYRCENRPLSDQENFKPKEIHENIKYHFDKISVDGIEYLILSRDNNNPHEGFGFMAFRGNELIARQDSIFAYLRSLNRMQMMLYAKVMNKNLEETKKEFNEIYTKNLAIIPELESLGLNTFSNELE